MKFTNNSIFDILVAAGGLIGIGYGLAMHNKLSKVSDRLDRSIDSLADDMEIDIPKEMVDKAVQKAVTAAAKNAVNTAANSALAELKNDIRIKVSAAIDGEYSNIKDNILKEATLAASKIDVAKVRRDVEEAAKEAALEKFDDNLDDILATFNANLTNTAKIYQNIQTTLTPSSIVPTATPKEYIFRVG